MGALPSYDLVCLPPRSILMENHRTLDRISQLPHVTGLGVVREEINRIVLKSADELPLQIDRLRIPRDPTPF